MVKKEVFICDNCAKTSPNLTEGLDPPYMHGWRYMDEFEFKASPHYRHEVIRKHFCSNHCMLDFIQHFIMEEEDKIHTVITEKGVRNV